MAIKVGVIGKDGRTTAIIRKCQGEGAELHCLSEWSGRSNPREEVLENAARFRPDFVIVGPEDPLAKGIVDDLQAAGFPCIGPVKALAQLEASKSFTRRLLEKHNIPGNPQYRAFTSMDGIGLFLEALGEYVVKPDGLTGGKGVQLSNEHLFSTSEALDYSEKLFKAGHKAVVVEEKLEGEEFSLQAFCDGKNVVDMVLVQDHKRAHENDTGPNTGGMGSYSMPDHGLPFVTAKELAQAKEINSLVAQALRQETGHQYKGILYGGFMVTAKGLRLLEYNARFGDPETLNVLALLDSSLLDICQAIINGELKPSLVRFKPLASVCKYVVPLGYPENPVRNVTIEVPPLSGNVEMYEAAVEHRGNELVLTGSRGVAFVGLGKTLSEAEKVAEAAAVSVKGKVFHRKDIGTDGLVARRIEHMNSLRALRGSN